MNRAHHPEEQAGERSESDRHQQRREIHPRHIEIGETLRPERDERLEPNPPDDQSANASRAGENEALREELPDEPARASA